MDQNEFEGAAKDIRGRVKDGIGGFTGDAGMQVDGKVDRVVVNAQSAYGETVDAAREAVGDGARRASEYAQRVSGRARDAAETVRRQAGDVGGRLYDTGVQAGEAIGETVRKQPLLAVFGVAALGYLIGFLVHSPSSPVGPTPPPPRRNAWR